MARKSAAKVKPVSNVNSDKFLKKEQLPPIEKTFDNIKQVLVNTAEVQVVVAGRVENLINLRSAAYKFWGNELDSMYTMMDRMMYFKELQGWTVGIYEDILDIVRSFELDEFLREDMKDYFEVIVPKIGDIETENDLFVAGLMTDCIKPWGEKMTQLHHQMLEEQAKRQPVVKSTIDGTASYIEESEDMA